MDELASQLPSVASLVNPPDSEFQYYNDPGKTRRALRDGSFTAGDLG